MEDKSKTNLSKIEKIVIAVYIIYALIIGIIYNKVLVSIIALLFMVYIASTRKKSNTNANYLIKEKLELLIRHFFLLAILWNVIIGWIGGDVICEDSFTTTICYSVLLMVLLMPFLGILKTIYRLERTSKYRDADLYRELPQNIEPAIIANVMQDQVADKSDISATLLDLVRRGYLTIEDNLDNSFKNISDGILDKKLVIKKNCYDLREYERFLISWFSETSENRNEINMSKLKDMLKNSEKFKDNYNKWEELIKNESGKVSFYHDNSKLSKFSKFSEKWGKRVLNISLVLLSFILVGILSGNIIEISEEFALVVGVLTFINIILSVLGIIIYDLRLPEEYLNEIGNSNIKQWLGFIKFLKEYTLIDKRKSEEVYIWQEYLVYGVAFGVAKETINAMDKAYGFHSYPKK